MSTKYGSVSANDPNNGLIGNSRGHLPGTLSEGEDLINQWTRTYKKYKWVTNFNEQGALSINAETLYEVTVKGNGSILVCSGDWISKYSDAIHGNPWQWAEYARKDANGQLIPISILNAGRIEAGETLYHIPSVPQIDFSKIIIQPELTSEEKTRVMLEHLKKSRLNNVSGLDDGFFNILGDSVTALNDITGNIDKILNATEMIVDIAGSSGRIATNIGPIAEVVGGVAVILGFLMIPFQMAEMGKKEFNVRRDASIATIVAYAFDDNRPTPSKHTIDNISQMFPDDIPKYRTDWDKVVNETYAYLHKAALKYLKPTILKAGQKFPDHELILKLGLRVIAENDRNKLRNILYEQIKK